MHCQIDILTRTPTRVCSELSYQISQQIEALGATIGVRCATIVGGMDMMTQSIALSKRPHVIVATPGLARSFGKYQRVQSTKSQVPCDGRSGPFA